MKELSGLLKRVCSLCDKECMVKYKGDHDDFYCHKCHGRITNKVLDMTFDNLLVIREHFFASELKTYIDSFKVQGSTWRVLKNSYPRILEMSQKVTMKTVGLKK